LEFGRKVKKGEKRMSVREKRESIDDKMGKGGWGKREATRD
jgi:hypothetical protein